MSQLTAISEALDFVERHLKRDIGIADMADAAGYSLYHFCRVFNGLVHHTPYDYLMRRRLSESARKLLETDWNVVDVAFEYQFNSHETYSRAFKRMFGVPPSRYRTHHNDQRTRVDQRVWMPRLTKRYLRHINRNDDLRPTLREKDALHLTGLMSLVKATDTIAHLWVALQRELDHLADRSWEYYGIAWHRDEWPEGGFFYMAAVDSRPPDACQTSGDAAHALPSALVMKTLPPLTCARFVHRGPRTALDLTRGYIYHTWLPQSDVRPVHLMEIEYHGRQIGVHREDETGWELLIPIE